MIKNRDKIDDFFNKKLREITQLIENPQNEKIYGKDVDANRTMDFLVNELNRLKKLRSFFLYKLSNQTEYPQIENLIKLQISDTALIKDELLPKLCKNDSIVNNQLERLFDKTFS